jgi:hypothetical protein
VYARDAPPHCPKPRGWVAPPCGSRRAARSGVGDEVLAELAILPLRQLDLLRTDVTDACLARLAGLPLEQLDLGGTGIGEAGLGALAALPRLAQASLARTRVTEAGVTRLREQRPGLSIAARWPVR